MDQVTLIGLLAGTLTTIAFIPQLQQTWRTRSAQDVSLGMLLTFVTGVFLWLIYGIMLGALPTWPASSTSARPSLHPGRHPHLRPWWPWRLPLLRPSLPAHQ